MTIKTLTFIHEMLKEETNIRKEAKDHIYKIWENAVEENKPNADYIREQYNTAKEKYYQASQALEDFESQEW